MFICLQFALSTISACLTPVRKERHFKQIYGLKTETFIPINFDESTRAQHEYD